MRLMLAAVVLSLVGCTATPETRWRGDARFTADQRSAIEAANIWEAEQMGVAPIIIEWTTPVDDDCSHSIVVADLPAGEIGSSSPNGCILIDVDQGADRVGVIFAHELGHVRGLKHHNGPGLMNARVPPTLEWSVEDRAGN